MNSKKVVYTAIFNNYDILIDPKNTSEDIEYICFTDRETEIDSDIWRTIVVDDIELPANMKNRLVKMKPYKFLSDFDRSLYVDGNVVLKGDIDNVFQKYSNEKMVVPSHPDRDCTYAEAEGLKQASKADKEKIESQMDRYREEGFPENFGLSENNVIYRKHNDSQVKELMEAWWCELENNAERDQLSLSYVCWKKDFELKYMDEGPRSDYGNIFDLVPHRGSGLQGKFNEMVYIPLTLHRNRSRLHNRTYWLVRYSLKGIEVLKTEGLSTFFKETYDKLLDISRKNN